MVEAKVLESSAEKHSARIGDYTVSCVMAMIEGLYKLEQVVNVWSIREVAISIS